MPVTPQQDLNLLAAKAAIANMIKKGYIDICAIDNVMKLLGITVKENPYQVLRTVHCICFGDLDPELRAELPVLLAQVIKADGIDWSQVFEPRRFPAIPAAPVRTEDKPLKIFGITIP